MPASPRIAPRHSRTIPKPTTFTVSREGDSRFVGRDRMYIVEVRHDGDGLAQPLARVRTWLDRERIQPSVFRMSLVLPATIFHLEFKTASEAEAFARAFAGQLIGG